jgi:hypothetical protein
VLRKLCGASFSLQHRLQPMSGRLTDRELWWALLDSNQRPTDYESAALTAVLRARSAG